MPSPEKETMAWCCARTLSPLSACCTHPIRQDPKTTSSDRQKSPGATDKSIMSTLYALLENLTDDAIA